MAREDNFEKLFKCTSKASSEYDDKTAEMIQLLHKTKDEQVVIIYSYKVAYSIYSIVNRYGSAQTTDGWLKTNTDRFTLYMQCWCL